MKLILSNDENDIIQLILLLCIKKRTSDLTKNYETKVDFYLNELKMFLEVFQILIISPGHFQRRFLNYRALIDFQENKKKAWDKVRDVISLELDMLLAHIHPCFVLKKSNYYAGKW